MELELKKLGLKRYKKHGVGKEIGDNIWFHKDYVHLFLEKKLYEQLLQNLPDNYEFTILRLSESKKEVTFIQCVDFDISNEPVVGCSIKMSLAWVGEHLYTLTKPSDTNPLIYHHKWLFVSDDYSGFDVAASKQRSLEWKSVLGVNRSISSRIGRMKYWDEWLNKNQLLPRI